MLGLTKGLLNHQKSRVDFLLELSENKKIKPNVKEIKKFLKFKYMSGIIKQQEFNFFTRNKPDLIIFDSYSELTDQLFKNNRSDEKFLLNYGDLKHNDEFKMKYCAKGLLDLENIYQIYNLFFKKIRNRYNDVPIIFIHFPSKLESRYKFKLRGEMIKKAIDKLSGKYSYLYSVSIEDNLVRRAKGEELKDFPYHYSIETYNAFIVEIKKILEKNKLVINGK